MGKIYNLIIISLLILLFPAYVLSYECEEAKKWYQEGLTLSNNSTEETEKYRKAIELCPEYMEAHLRLGNVFKAKQEWDLAVKELKLVCEKSHLSESWTSLGEIYRMQGQYELAAQTFQIALDFNPKDKVALANLEYIYRVSDQYDEGHSSSSLVPALIFGREPGFTLPRGETMFDLYLQSWQLARDTTTKGGGAANIWKLTLGIRYGLTNNLTLGIIPRLFRKKAYILRRDEELGATQEYRPSTYGLGDTIVLFKYCLWYHRQTSLAAGLGISLPTGDEGKTAQYAGNMFGLPLGSGKYEFIPSLSFSTNLRKLGFLHTGVQYFFNRTKDKGPDPGYEVRYNIGFCHLIPLLSTTYLFSIPVNGLVAQMELNGVYMGESKGYSDEGDDSQYSISAGHTFFVSPGVQLMLDNNMKMEAGIQYPVILPDEPWIKKPVLHLGLVKFFF